MQRDYCVSEKLVTLSCQKLMHLCRHFIIYHTSKFGKHKHCHVQYYRHYHLSISTTYKLSCNACWRFNKCFIIIKKLTVKSNSSYRWFFAEPFKVYDNVKQVSILKFQIRVHINIQVEEEEKARNLLNIA